MHIAIGDRLHYDFTANEPVDFNIHYHEDAVRSSGRDKTGQRRVWCRSSPGLLPDVEAGPAAHCSTTGSACVGLHADRTLYAARQGSYGSIGSAGAQRPYSRFPVHTVTRHRHSLAIPPRITILRISDRSSNDGSHLRVVEHAIPTVPCGTPAFGPGVVTGSEM